MRVLFLTGRELTYSRNDVLRRALEKLGTVDRVREMRATSLPLRSALTFLRALPKLLSRRYDLVFVGFYGHLIMLPIGVVTRSPVLFDAFISTYDTLCFDRQVFKPDSLRGRLAFWLDKKACSLSSAVTVDTPQHADYFINTFKIARKKIFSVPVGCNEEIFSPRPLTEQGSITRVLYYSTYQPLHGADAVVRAAAFLRSETQLRFELIGDGPQFGQVRRLVEDLKLTNIALRPTVSLDALAARIACADICVGGHFGISGKAARVVPGKVYQILAMGRSLIASRTEANEALLTHLENAWLCRPDSSEDLANAILNLHKNPALRERIAAAGHALYLGRCSEAVIAEQVEQIVGRLIRPHKNGSSD